MRWLESSTAGVSQYIPIATMSRIVQHVTTQLEILANRASVGLHVIASARNPDVLQELVSLGMSAVQLDVTNQDSLNRAKHDVAQITGGRLDILVNNACVPHLYILHRLHV